MPSIEHVHPVAGSTTTTSLTTVPDITVSADESLLVLTAQSTGAADGIVGAAWHENNLEPLTRVASAVNEFGVRVEAWALPAPTAATDNLYVQWAAPSRVAVAALVISGAGAASIDAMIGTVSSVPGTGTAPSLVITGSAESLFVDALGILNGANRGPWGPTEGQTEQTPGLIGAPASVSNSVGLGVGSIAGSVQDTLAWGINAATAFGILAVEVLMAVETPVTVPDAVDDLAAAAVSASRIDLSWTNKSGTEAVEVYRHTSASFTPPGTGTLVDTLGAVTSFTDTGLDADTAYYYRIIGTNGEGDSDPSNEVTATTREAAVEPDPDPLGIQVWEDFGAIGNGVALEDNGWTQTWGTPHWVVRSGISGALHGRVARLESTGSTTQEEMITIDAMIDAPGREHVEGLMRFRGDNPTPAGRTTAVTASVRVAGDYGSPDTREAYNLGWAWDPGSTSQFAVVTKNDGGDAQVVGFGAFALTVAAWYWLRWEWDASSSGLLRFKLWTGDLGDEPGGWTISDTDTDLTGPGLVGVASLASADELLVDLISIGTGGRPPLEAPPTAVGEPPSAPEIVATACGWDAVQINVVADSAAKETRVYRSTSTPVDPGSDPVVGTLAASGAIIDAGRDAQANYHYMPVSSNDDGDTAGPVASATTWPADAAWNSAESDPLVLPITLSAGKRAPRVGVRVGRAIRTVQGIGQAVAARIEVRNEAGDLIGQQAVTGAQLVADGIEVAVTLSPVPVGPQTLEMTVFRES